MKLSRYLFPAVLVVLCSTVFGCAAPSNPVVDSERVSSADLNGIYLFEEDETTWRYLNVPGSGNSLYRTRISRNYSLDELRKETNCVIRVENVVQGGVTYKTMRMHDEPTYWIGASKTFSPSGQEEPFASISERSTTPTAMRHFFKIHTFGKRDGKAVVAVESMEYPGHYFESLGHTFTGNGVRLVAHSSPESAQKLYIHRQATGFEIAD